MELVRKILLALEKHPHGYAPSPLAIDGYDEEKIGYHVFLMGQEQADLLKVAVITAVNDPSPKALPAHLTWNGHEFLDNVKNETVWQRIKGIVVSKGGSVSFEVLKTLATETAKGYFLQP